MSIDKIIEESLSLENNSDKVLTYELDNFYDNNMLKKIKCPDRVIFKSEQEITSLNVNDLIKINNYFDLIINDIKSYNLSPYENYIAIYNIVRSFKDYKFYKDSLDYDQLVSDQSRNPYLIMNNEWCVCVGYVKLLMHLLKKVNINSLEWRVETEQEYHDIMLVNLVDSKYDINGYYLSDPTSDLSYDITYPMTHVNMTFHEALIKHDPNIGQEYKDLYLDKFYDIHGEKSFNLYKNFDNTIKNYDDIRAKIDIKIDEIKTIDAFMEVYKNIYKDMSKEELLNIKNKLIYNYNYLFDIFNQYGLGYKKI